MGEIKNLVDKRQRMNESLMTESEKNAMMQSWADKEQQINTAPAQDTSALFYDTNNPESRTVYHQDEDYKVQEEQEAGQTDRFNDSSEEKFQSYEDNDSKFIDDESKNDIRAEKLAGIEREAEELQGRIDDANEKKRLKEKQTEKVSSEEKQRNEETDRFSKRDKTLRDTSKVKAVTGKLDKVNSKDSKFENKNLDKLRGKNTKKKDTKKKKSTKKKSVVKSALAIGSPLKNSISESSDDATSGIKGMIGAVKGIGALATLPFAIIAFIPMMALFIIIILAAVGGAKMEGEQTPSGQYDMYSDAPDDVLAREVYTYKYLLNIFDGNDIAVCGIMGNMMVESAGSFRGTRLEIGFANHWNVTDEIYTKGIDSGNYAGAPYFTTGAGKSDDIMHKFSHDFCGSFDKQNSKYIYQDDRENASMGAGYGICQFTWYTKKEDLYNIAKSRNCSVGDLDMQLYYMFGTKDSSMITEINKPCNVANDEFRNKMATLKTEGDIPTAVGVMGCWEMHGGYSDAAYNSYGNDVYAFNIRVASAKAAYLQFGQGRVNQIITKNISQNNAENLDMNSLAANSGSNVISTQRGAVGVLGTAYSQVGYYEKSSNSNLDDFAANAGSSNFTKFGRDRGCNGQPWCAAFVSWCFIQSENQDALGGMDSSINWNMAVSYKNWGEANGRIVSGADAQPGDIFWRTSGGWTNDHTGFIVANNGDGTFQILDGNGSDNMVSVRTWSPSSGGWTNWCIIRPNYAESTKAGSATEQTSYLGIKTLVDNTATDNIWYEAWLNNTDFLGYYITGEDPGEGTAWRLMDNEQNVIGDGEINAPLGSIVTLYECGVWNGTEYEAPTNEMTGNSVKLKNTDTNLESRIGYYSRSSFRTVSYDVWKEYTPESVPKLNDKTSP